MGAWRSCFKASVLEKMNDNENDVWPMWWIRRPLLFPTKTSSYERNYNLVMRLLRFSVRWSVAPKSKYHFLSWVISSVASFTNGDEDLGKNFQIVVDEDGPCFLVDGFLEVVKAL